MFVLFFISLFNINGCGKKSKRRRQQSHMGSQRRFILIYNRPASIQHPETGEKIWFNQVTTHNCSYFQQLPGGTEIPDHKQPCHTYYGNGSDIEPAVLQHILDTTWTCAVGFKWRKGDLLALDNLAVQHGRLGFKGERKLLVYMTV